MISIKTLEIRHINKALKVQKLYYYIFYHKKNVIFRNIFRRQYKNDSFLIESLPLCNSHSGSPTVLVDFLKSNVLIKTLFSSEKMSDTEAKCAQLASGNFSLQNNYFSNPQKHIFQSEFEISSDNFWQIRENPS